MQKGRALDVTEEEMPEWGSNQVMEHHVVVAVLCSLPILHARPTMDQVVKILETHSYNWSLSLGPLDKDTQQLSIQMISNLDR
jgi:hypothetical protein